MLRGPAPSSVRWQRNPRLQHKTVAPIIPRWRDSCAAIWTRFALKALEKDRARRYATPAELAADIGRYLRNEPVLARPASVGYRARKYIRRYRVAVGITGVAVAQTIELRRTRRERDRADRVTNFMTGMFKVSDSGEARGNDIRAREILDNAAKDIDTGLAEDPKLQAEMMQVIGNVYDSLGLYSKAESLLRQAVEIRRRTMVPITRRR
jgi:eukaryotic-like serine/threonine-protein kinase